MTLTTDADTVTQVDQAPVVRPGATTVLGDTLQGRYTLEQRLGEGMMATVYRARDTALDRLVAVKLLHPVACRESTFVDRFLDMERRIARLFHPHLVTIYDAASGDEGCYVVMEYVAGGSLRDRLRADVPLPPAEAVRLVSEVAEALQLLHEHGIVHGDLKPDNILLDAFGSAKLADFGIAHLATTTGVITRESLGGTAAYLAPEQVREGTADRRSDLYSLGIVAYELLAGRRPFEGDNWVAVVAQRLERDPVPVSSVRPAVPADLDSVVMRALARTPDARWRSAAELREALLAALPANDSGRPLPLVRRAVSGSSPVQELPTPPAPARVVRSAPPRPPSLGALARRARHPRAIAMAGGLAFLLALIGFAWLPRLLDPPHPVQVPRVAGVRVEEARTAARGVGLTLTTEEEFSESAARGIVLRQEPPPGATLQSDQPVRVIVSGGPPPVRVPDLAGRRLEDARLDLAAAGLTTGKVEERETPQQPWGVVVNQSVRASGEVPRGGPVDVVVSVPPWTNAPKVTDRSLGDAEAELEKRGLRIGAVRQQSVAGRRAGTVLAQDPAADVRLRQGQEVAVTIAVPPSTPGSGG